MFNGLNFRKMGTLIIILFVCSLSFGCFLNSSDDSGSGALAHIEPSTVSVVTHLIEPVVPATTYTLEQKLANYPATITHGTNSITLTPVAPSPALRGLNYAFTTSEVNIQPGDILGGGPTTDKPNGYLKKVKSVSTVNGKINIDTENAAMEESIQDAHMTISHPVKQKQVKSFSPAIAGVKLNDKEFMHDDIKLDVNIVIHDADGDEETKDDQIKASGEISLQMSLDGVIKIKWFKLEQFKLYGKLKEQLNLTITGSKALTVKKEIPLGHFDIEPLTFFVGFVPVVIVPKIDFNLTFDGSLSAQASLGFTQTYSCASGIQLASGKLAPYSEGPVFNVTPLTQTLGVTAAIDIGVGPELEASFYDIGGPGIGVDLYFSADATAQETSGKPSAELDFKIGLRGIVSG